MISDMYISQNIHIWTKLQKVDYKSTTILVKTISTLGLVSEYHEFSITTKPIDLYIYLPNSR